MLIPALLIAGEGGCARKTYDPAWATQPYPRELHGSAIADMHVFRDGESIELVNSTARSYEDFDLWVNQRYVHHVESLPAGKTVELSLWNFKDEYGNCFNAGGFFRTYEPTPVRMVEIQTKPEEKTIGLVTIRREEIRLRTQ
jgi:hypothetical protein